ncbi:MAG: hypothetical protein ACLQMH_03780 [Solirubrobacteraceae bacterium]
MESTGHHRVVSASGPAEQAGDAGGGVSFPQEGGRRSTSATGRAIFADAAAAVDPDLAERILQCSDWRDEYLQLLRELTVASAAGGSALAIARAGLESMRSRLVAERGGRESSLEDALGQFEPVREIGTGRIHGDEAPVTTLRVPYRGRELHGKTLIEQLERWVDAGSMEPSFAHAVRSLVEHPEWLSLGGRKVALVGAGAEIGPLEPLCSWGADVIALDLPRPAIWERIGALARGGAGTVHIPVAADGSQGVDVLRELPEARAWLARTVGDDDLVLGMHAYADGGEHVRVSGAFDALASDFLARDPTTALAFLATPTDAFVAPQDAINAARAAYAARRLRRLMQAPAQILSGGRLFSPAYADGVSVADALVKQQGPNYALAKRLQRWRGIITDASGLRVSFNVAPATWTRSVTKNRILAAAYGGARHFGIEVFAPRTTRVLMAALLVHDLHQEPVPRSDPESLFSDAAAHGGLWRAAYEARSALGIAALAGLPSTLLGRDHAADGER